MLTRLLIENIALVDQLELTFDPGLSVLSGETGAGKSVIVTAIALALGDRAEKEFIRQGCDQAVVEATFDISALPGRYKKAFADYLSDKQLVVRRELTRHGQSKVKINQELSSVSRLKELTSPIAEIVGQHASQMLMDEDNHLIFLDNFANLNEACQSVRVTFHEWETVHKELKRLIGQRDQLTAERELLLFQRKEIDDAAVLPGEENELLIERKILDSSRALIQSSAMISDALDGEDVSALNLLRAASKELQKMAEIDETLDEKASELVDLDFRLSELRQSLEQYGSNIPDDPARLEEINLRLDELYRLKKKYGSSEEAIIETLAEINRQLADRPNVSARIEQLEQANERLRAEYSDKATALSEARHKAAKYLATIVLKELTELAINAGGFEFQFIYEEYDSGIILDGQAVKPFAHGLEHGRILFSANPGEAVQSLVKTASGGEISRVLLALKAAETKQSGKGNLMFIFDEVDAGIGGQTAIEVGRKLKKLSVKNQTIVITHLHQIARLADHHYLADKTEINGRSVISVRRLDESAKRLEIDRMVALPEA